MVEQQVSRAVLITGCSSGIGRAAALRLSGAGWPVYATARDPASLADLQAAGCRVAALDVCDEGSLRAAVGRVERECGAVGVLVNNAGFGQEGAVEEVPIDKVRRQFETNVFGPVRLIQLVLPGMRRQGWGRIVNVSSMGGKLTLPYGAFYHASKHALEALSDALRFELEPFGIHVAVIEPGPVRTAFHRGAEKAWEGLGGERSPYRALHESARKAFENGYEGPMKVFAASPESVARVIERALTARRPRTRYPVTLAARALLALRRWLPDRAFDLFLKTQFTQPLP